MSVLLIVLVPPASFVLAVLAEKVWQRLRRRASVPLALRVMSQRGVLCDPNL